MKPGIRQIRKRPFLIFTIITGSLLLSALIFIQSRRFADIVKGAIVRYIPEDLGVVGNFSEFEVSFMPPGVSILNPELKLGEKNLLSLPEGSTVSAKRLGLYFYPLQMLTGKIRVQELLIADGKVHLLLDLKALKARKPAKPDTKLDWKQLFQVKADALSLEHIDLDVEVTDPALKAALTVDHLRVAQDVSRSGPGYDMDLEFRTIEGEYPEAWRVPHSIDRVMLQAFVNATGVDLRRAEVSTGGFEAKAGGRLKGDVLDPKKLLLSSDTELRGDVGKALALLGVEADAGGNFEYRGRLSADLMNVGTTLGLGGKFSADKVHYGKWYADRVEIDGQTETEGDFANTAIKVNRVMLSSERTERQGGHHPGSGGKVEFEPFTFHPNMKDPIEVTAHLEDAHIHWLAAGGIKDVYPMDFRVSGPLKAHFDPPVEGHPWAARAELGFHIPRFTLDNQKFGKEKKLSTLLDVAELKLEGGVKVGPTGIVPDGLVLSMPHTRFAVGGDLVFGRGYGLDIQGPVDMVDFKTLSGKEIQGRGTLHTRVTGPSSRVFIDFEPRLDGAFYLGLKVGDIRDGHLVWDDDPGDLIFKSLHIQKGITDYTVNGKLNLGIPEEKGSLDVEVAGGSISDFTGIFENLTKDLWWFPSSLTGPLQGNLTLRGPLSIDKMEVLADLKGRDWLFYSEKLRNVSIKGGYRRGTYFIDRADLVKDEGRILGSISYDEPTHKIDWDLETSGMTLADVDHLARLDVPLKGNLSINSRGRGKIGAVESTTQASLSKVTVRGVAYPPSRVAMVTSGGVVTAEGEALGGQGTLDLRYDFAEGGNSHFRSELRHLDFSPVLMLLNSRLMGDRTVTGRVSGKIDLGFKTGQADLGTGSLELTEYVLSRADEDFRLASPASARIEGGNFQIPAITLQGASHEAILQLSAHRTELEGRIRGRIGLGVFEFLTSTVQKAEGAMDLDFRIGGTIKEPKIGGTAAISGARLRIRGVESPFESVEGLFELGQNVLTVKSLTADLAGGNVTTGGTLTLFADRAPTLNLNGQINNCKLQIYPFQYVRARGGVHVHGDHLPYVVDGNIRILSALSRENVLNRDTQAGGLKVAKYTPPPVAADEGDYPKFRLNVHAQADEGINVKNDLFDAELKADINVVNTLEAPRLTGSAETLHGKLVFKDQTFQIQSARVEFDSPLVIDPKFSLTANAEVKNVKVQLYASGRMSEWKLQLTSNPAMAETDIIQLLAQGVAPDQMSRINAGDRNILQQKDAASLLLQALDFNRDVKDKTGLEIQLDQAVSNQVGSSITRKANEADTGAVAAPKIVIKRQIGKNLDISVGSTVGVGTGSQQELNAEVKVAPGVSVIGVWNTSEGANAQDSQTSYGVDLKVQQRFK